MSEEQRIIYFTQEEISTKPPCVSEVLILKDLGVDVRVLTTWCNAATQKLFRERGIPCTLMRDGPSTRKNGRSQMFRKAMNAVRYQSMLHRYFRANADSRTAVWLGTEKSLMSYPRFWKQQNRLIQNALEFYEKPDYQKHMKNYTAFADVTTACESHRAALMKQYWHLREDPFVLPNKPYLHPGKRNLEGSTPENRERIRQMAGKKVLLYQGIFSPDRDLMPLAKALAAYEEKRRSEETSSGHDSDAPVSGEHDENVRYSGAHDPLWLVLIGSGDNEFVSKLKEAYPYTMNLGFVPAPLHLEITSHARYCVAYYKDNTLNNRYCAPNKIYEAAGFGIPVLANQVPGLTSTVGASGAGRCVNFDDPAAVAEALDDMEEHYDRYSAAARKFFDDTDNADTVRRIVERAFAQK